MKIGEKAEEKAEETVEGDLEEKVEERIRSSGVVRKDKLLFVIAQAVVIKQKEPSKPEFDGSFFLPYCDLLFLEFGSYIIAMLLQSKVGVWKCFVTIMNILK
jgi:hypothetical protein